MITNKVLQGNSIDLRQIEESDVNDCYVKWLNDNEITQYLETKWYPQNIETIKSFVINQRNSKDSFLFAIIKKNSNEHIGNIKIGPIHPHYKHADISYFIGEKQYWGGGIATEAIRLIVGFGFAELGLHRIEAGTYSLAIGSQRALEKNGFTKDGVFKEQVFFNNEFIDIYRYSVLNK